MILTQHDWAQLEGPGPDRKKEARRLINDAVLVAGSRKQLAEWLGVAPSTLAQWRNGGRPPNQHRVDSLKNIIKGARG